MNSEHKLIFFVKKARVSIFHFNQIIQFQVRVYRYTYIIIIQVVFECANILQDLVYSLSSALVQCLYFFLYTVALSEL